MRKVIDILKSVEIVSIHGDETHLINELVFDSRLAGPESLFFALQGTNQDGHDYIQNVLDNGCMAVVVSKALSLPENITQIIVDDTHKALSLAACNFYDSPSSKLRLIGVTGTNGKTTTATLLYNLFSDMSFSVGLLSTVVNKIGKVDVPATHTTPNPIELNRLLAEMVEQGCSYCFMEVSSHAIHQKRILGLSFFGGVFTNITHDHLDYHQTF